MWLQMLLNSKLEHTWAKPFFGSKSVRLQHFWIWIGLSPALGAFLGGVVLADNDFRHEIEADIAPFKSLLLGVFFISVGAGINLHQLVCLC